MKRQHKLDAMREDFENGRFPLVPTRGQLDAMQRATRSLIDGGQADHALKAGAAVAAKFGLRFALPDDLIKVYRQFGNDLPTINDDPARVLPMPARYVIEMDGVIAYAAVNPDYTRRPDPPELMPVLDHLRVGSPA